jgi:hypothetical protein
MGEKKKKLRKSKQGRLFVDTRERWSQGADSR